MELIKCRGIVLYTREFRDNKHIHSLFTDDYGKIQLISRGSKKITSRSRESLMLLSRSEFVLKPGRNFWNLRSSHLEKAFQVRDYENYTLATDIIRILDSIIPPDFIDPRIFLMTEHYIDFIENMDNDIHELIRLTYIMKLLFFLGQFPSLDQCECGSMTGEDFHACVKESALICEKCTSDMYVDAVIFSKLELASLQMLLRWNYDILSSDRYPGFRKICDYFYEYISWHFHVRLGK